MQYIILYHNGGKKWITKNQAINISKAMDNPTSKFVDIGEETKISISSIGQVLSEREYEEQYPGQETGRIFKNQFKKLSEHTEQYETIDQQAMRSKNGRQQLIAGLQKYINENPDRSENAKVLLKEKKIKFGMAN